MKALVLMLVFSTAAAKEIYNNSCKDLSVAILNCNHFRCQSESKVFKEQTIIWEVHGWVEKNKCVISKIVPSNDGPFAYTCAYSQPGRNALAKYHEFNLNEQFPIVHNSYKSYCELNSYDQFLKRF